jgi:hypothetical protein
LRGRIRGQERHAGRAGRLAAARRDRHGDAIGAGVRRGEVELRRAADDGRRRGSIVEDPRRGEGELAGRAGDVRRDVDREARSRGVDDRERLQVRLRIAEHTHREGLRRDGAARVGDGEGHGSGRVAALAGVGVLEDHPPFRRRRHLRGARLEGRRQQDDRVALRIDPVPQHGHRDGAAGGDLRLRPGLLASFDAAPLRGGVLIVSHDPQGHGRGAESSPSTAVPSLTA